MQDVQHQQKEDMWWEVIEILDQHSLSYSSRDDGWNISTKFQKAVLVHGLSIHSTNHSIRLFARAETTPRSKQALYFQLLPANPLLKGWFVVFLGWRKSEPTRVKER